MIKSLRAAFVTSVVGLAGCVGSLYTLWTGPDMVSEPGIVGTWTDSTGKGWVDVRATGPAVYRVTMRDDSGKIGMFQGMLGRLDGRLVLDVQPNVTQLDVPAMYMGMLQPMHTFVLLDSIGEHPRFSILDTDSLRKYLVAHPAAVRADTFGGGVILEGPPRRLQAFLRVYLQRPGVASPPGVMRRCEGCQVPK